MPLLLAEGMFRSPVGLSDCVYELNPPGDLYVCGVISLAANGGRGIARFDGQAWSAPGGGVLGGFANGSAMAIYQGDLYLGGTIYLPAGNAGHMIQRWDGTTWHPVGGHLLNANNDFTSAARCDGLFVHEDKLLAAGGFQHAGGVPAQTFAIWDGSEWCGTGDAITEPVMKIRTQAA